MRLGELADGLGVLHGDGETRVTGLAYHSSAVTVGDLFVCVPGHKVDGHRYADAAVRRGAVALVVERLLPELPVPQVVVPDARAALALLSHRAFGDPTRRLRLIGVTGTNGKTTVTYMTQAILEAAGRPAGLIGTIEYRFDGDAVPAGRTTPESLDLVALLARWAARGCEYAVMEVSSHAMALKRVHGCRFRAGVFTNLGHDHLDFHRNREEYFRAKASLFADGSCQWAILNVDDPMVARLTDAVPARVLSFGIRSRADLVAREIRNDEGGVAFTCEGAGAPVRVRLPFHGVFNVYNALAALAVSRIEGLDLAEAAGALESMPGIPGRGEWLEGPGFSVVIDFAHNPEALAEILRCARSRASSRVIAVFGCEGGKDPTKRPMMGEVAARLADDIVITSDNTYWEDPEDIARAVLEGVRRVPGREGRCEVILDRREAIRRALDLAAPGSVVVVAGKGHEREWIVGDERIPLNDREEVLRLLAQRVPVGPGGS